MSNQSKQLSKCAMPMDTKTITQLIMYYRPYKMYFRTVCQKNKFELLFFIFLIIKHVILSKEMYYIMNLLVTILFSVVICILTI